MSDFDIRGEDGEPLPTHIEAAAEGLVNVTLSLCELDPEDVDEIEIEFQGKGVFSVIITPFEGYVMSKIFRITDG